MTARSAAGRASAKSEPTQSPPKTRAAKKAAPRDTTAQPRRRGGSSADDLGTRQKLIDAAIRTILEQGFYRASSNAIADTAGLSWGVIQYYFGSRENLMLSVLEEGTRRLSEDLAKADLSGKTLTERFEQYFGVLEGYYGTPDYLAFVQVLLNLSHDPRTSEQARRTMITARDTVDADLKRLTNKLFAGTGIRRASLRNLPFQALRGLAMSEVMIRSLPYESASLTRVVNDGEHQRYYLAQALTLLVESEAAGSALPV